MNGQPAASQEVTNATLLIEIRHLGERMDAHICADKEQWQEQKDARKDHESRLRTLEESSAVFRYFMAAWNTVNTAGLIGALAGLFK